MITSGEPVPAAGTDPLWVLLLSGAVFLYAHLPAFTSPFVINDDVHQQIYWMQQWLDPELFRGDLNTEYARHYVSWGLKALYWLASWAVEPLVFSKILPGLLFISLGVLFFQIGARLGGRILAWTAVGLYWLMPFFLDHLAGGLARGFAAPLLALMLLGWLAARPRVVGLALLLQALFIPYVFPVGAASVVLAWLAARTGRFRPPPFPCRPVHFLVLAAGAGLVALMNLGYQEAGFGPLVSAAEMVNRPEFGPGGRVPILPVPSLLWEFLQPWEYLGPFKEGGPVAGAAVCSGVAALALIGIFRVDWRGLKDRLPPFMWLGLASVLLYFLARLLLLKLFIPDRYVIYTFNVCYCLVLALALSAALKVGRWPRSLAVTALILAAALGAMRLHGVGLRDYSAYQPLFAALAATPKDALVAGHPNLMDPVPTFARRPALAIYELAHPWSRGYWDQLRPRLDDLFRAYYAADPQEVVAFGRKYGISFLVVDDRHFRPDFLAGGRFFFPAAVRIQAHIGQTLSERVDAPFFAPFGEQIRRLVAGRRRFALLSWPGSHTLGADCHLRLLDLRPFLINNPPERGSTGPKHAGTPDKP